jgi:hypothetical protein
MEPVTKIKENTPKINENQKNGYCEEKKHVLKTPDSIVQAAQGFTKNPVNV